LFAYSNQAKTQVNAIFGPRIGDAASQASGRQAGVKGGRKAGAANP
jgi:hypothetical protein